MTTEFSIKTFDKLTSVDVYHILKARSQVFVVEQKCVYQDMDEIDFDCLHLVAHQDQKLVGYCRIIAPEFNNKRSLSRSANQMSAIGRVLVVAEYRGKGVARQLMTQAIAHSRKRFGKKGTLIISAQTHLLEFYKSLGFMPEGEHYLEDGIEHVIMTLSPLEKVKIHDQGFSLTTALTVLGIFLGLFFIGGLVYLIL